MVGGPEPPFCIWRFDLETEDKLFKMKGRGVDNNPANRFERLSLEWDEPRLDRKSTQYLVDSSKSIIATNKSPDVAFDASINPYRGCEHGCSYCLDGETRILMADGSTRSLAEIRPGDEIYGTTRKGHYRKYTRTQVHAHWATRQPAYRIILADGTELIAGPNHRFLTERGWKYVVGKEQGPHRRPHLTTNNRLLGTGGSTFPPDESDHEYRRGYLCGMVRGDGHLASYQYEREGRTRGNVHQFRLALADEQALDRSRQYLENLGLDLYSFEFQPGTDTSRPVRAIRTSAREAVDVIRQVVEWPQSPSPMWQKGFLAGIFDAEGSYSRRVFRISNTDLEIIRQILDSMSAFGFECVVERPIRKQGKPLQVVRLLGGLKECLRFWHTTAPAISRKKCIEGQALKSGADLEILAIEPLADERHLYDIETGTGDFIANGVVSHNCFARNSHEFLGFSAGLDFETKILVKENAADLLRHELASSKWLPKPLGMSGVTDPYQPIERKLKVTRGCLEVLAEARNPVMLITKNQLVTRDLDLLAELASHNAVGVAISIPTLDGDLAKVMEPRASHPRSRLKTVRELNAAGIPTSVMIAPSIPGLTDHEIPAILDAAASAGAERANYILLKLPGAVQGIFVDWLDSHFPARKDKVLSRIRQLRQGSLNQSDFASRGRGQGHLATELHDFFEINRRRVGLQKGAAKLSVASFRPPETEQRRLF